MEKLELFRIDRKGFFFPDAEIRESSGKGRGVFALRRYEKDELIERAPTFTCEDSLLSMLYDANCDRTVFHDYVFNSYGIVHVALGWASIYNHSRDNNAHWKVDNEKQQIEIRARKAIEHGEEITVLYVNDPSKLWFENSENLSLS